MARGRQKDLPGIERKTIEEVDVAAEAYEAARDERMACSESETVAKQALIAVMQKHKLKVYRDENADPPLVVTIEKPDPTVKVKRMPTPLQAQEDENDEESDEDAAKALA